MPDKPGTARLVRGHNDLWGYLQGKSGPILIADGTVAAPAIAFANDASGTATDTGIYREGANQGGLAAGGVKVVTWLNSAGAVQFMLPDGTLSLPGLTFNDDGDTGIRRAGADDMYAIAGGVAVAEFKTTATKPQVLLADGVVGTPSLSFTSDPDTGIYHHASTVDDAFLVAGGAVVAEFKTTSTKPQFMVADGDATAPGFAFRSDPSLDTGLYRVSADEGGLTAGGTLVAKWKNTTGAVQFLFADGAAATPSAAFSSDPDTGFYSVSANRIGVTAGTTKVAEFANPSGTQIGLGIGVQPSYALHVSAAYASDYVAAFINTSGTASKGVLIQTTTTAAADYPLQVMVNGNNRFIVQGDGKIRLDNNFTAGAPGVQTGYITVSLGGVDVKVPYYL